MSPIVIRAGVKKYFRAVDIVRLTQPALARVPSSTMLALAKTEWHLICPSDQPGWTLSVICLSPLQIAQWFMTRLLDYWSLVQARLIFCE